MNILDREYPILASLNLETEPMQIATRLANALIEASDLAKALPELREAIAKMRENMVVLEEQIARAEQREKDALASRDRAVEKSEAISASYADLVFQLTAANDEINSAKATIFTLRADLETVNSQRIQAEAIANDHLAECGRLTEKLKTTSEQAFKMEADLISANINTELAVEKWNTERAEYIDRATKAEAKLNAMLDILTA